jgi:hypothetical protein
MTRLLKKAITEMEKLPEPEQDAVAAVVLEEIASEQRWTQLLEKSQDKLAKLAEQALADYDAGRTKPF